MLRDPDGLMCCKRCRVSWQARAEENPGTASLFQLVSGGSKITMYIEVRTTPRYQLEIPVSSGWDPISHPKERTPSHQEKFVAIRSRIRRFPTRYSVCCTVLEYFVSRIKCNMETRCLIWGHSVVFTKKEKLLRKPKKKKIKLVRLLTYLSDCSDMKPWSLSWRNSSGNYHNLQITVEMQIGI